jgi:hypothetical protein
MVPELLLGEHHAYSDPNLNSLLSRDPFFNYHPDIDFEEMILITHIHYQLYHRI